LERENILANVQARGEQLRAGLQQLAVKYPQHIAQVRGWGLIDGMELQADSHVNAIDVVKAAMNAGLLLVPAGVKVVRLVPPLIVSAAEIDRAVGILDRVLAAI
jgi:acetylornithine/N-succinyldiaminopimelate aminotransferase